MSGQEEALLVIRPRAEAAPRMEQALAGALAGRRYETVETAEALCPVADGYCSPWPSGRTA